MNSRYFPVLGFNVRMDLDRFVTTRRYVKEEVTEVVRAFSAVNERIRE